MRKLTIIALVVSAVHVNASFEMVLVSDSGDDVVHRFDPVTGGYLGSFGTGYLSNPLGIAIDQPNNTAYVLDAGNAIVKFDYNTGAFMGSFVVSGGATYLNRNPDGTLNLAYANRVERRNTAGGLIVTYTHGTGFVGQQGFHAEDGLFYVSTRTGLGSNGLSRHNYATGALIGTTSWAADRLIRLPGTNILNVYEGFGGGNCVFENDVFNNGPIFIQANSIAAIQNPKGVGLGHDGIAYACGTDRVTPAQGIIQRFDTNTWSYRGAFGQTILSVPTGMAVVVAPEPATWGAMAIGALALMRKRKPSR